MSLNDLHLGFRDDQQRRRAAAIVMDRLADDRRQDECRLLLRLWWQLSTRLPQLAEHELSARVGAAKLPTVLALVEALRSSPEAVDRWIEATEEMFPVVHDRGWSLAEARLSSLGGARERPALRQPPQPPLPAPVAGAAPDERELAQAEADRLAGTPGAALRLGAVLEGRGDMRRAQAAYRLAGEAGDPAAFYALGRVMLAAGEPQYQVAAEWQHAADAGLVDAMYALGVLEGASVVRSGRYLRQAAAAGHVPAWYALGCHAFERADYSAAADWWRQAADRGHLPAAEALEALRVDLSRWA